MKVSTSMVDHVLSVSQIIGSRVLLINYNSGWPQAFAEEKNRLCRLLEKLSLFIDHVGSTAVPNMRAKPYIDILVTLPDWKNAEIACIELEELGYLLVEHIEDVNPRYFFLRENNDGDPGFMIHLTPQASSFGCDMIDFRDALLLDGKLAKKYGLLKASLAQKHSNDLEAYTQGKAKFVVTVLARWKGAYGVNRLLTHQGAEFKRAELLQIAIIMVQLALAMIGARSVFSNDGPTLARLAALGGLLVVAWLIFGQLERKHRAAGDQARRAVLVRSGLGDLFSPQQLRTMMDRFSISVTNKMDGAIEKQFLTRRGPGERRLTEMLIESVYWTRELQKGGAWLVGAFFFTGTIIFTGIIWFSTVTMTGNEIIIIFRICLVFLVFLLSFDIVGAFLVHISAVRTLGIIQRRLEAAEQAKFPKPDVLLLMTDYNAAVEASPLVIPGIYWLSAKRIKRSWRNYAAAHSFSDDEAKQSEGRALILR